MSYIQDPNDSEKQVPRALSPNHGSKAIAPAQCTEVKAASYVLVNATGSYSFAYGTGVTTSSAADFTQAIVLGEQQSPGNVSSVRLDINATAWSGSSVGHDYDTGNVTFVYVNTSVTR